MYHCPSCPRTFPEISFYNKHSPMHSNKTRYHCEFPGCNKQYMNDESNVNHARFHGDEWFCRWNYGDANPLTWMAAYYRAPRPKEAPLSRADKALVVLRSSSTWGEQREANNPTLTGMLARQASYVCREGRTGPLLVENLAISRHATANVLGNRGIVQFLSQTPPSGAAILIINGPDCLSTMTSDWAILKRRFARITIYLVCGVDPSEVQDRVVPTTRGDGSWSVWGPRSWAQECWRRPCSDKWQMATIRL